MPDKRGQVTLFVVIAIIVVVGIVLILSIQQGAIKAPVGAEEAQKLVASQLQPISDFVVKCAEEPVKDSVKSIGIQGGYCNIPVRADTISTYRIPFLVQLPDKSNLLALEGDGPTIENEIIACTNMTKIMKCIDNFNSFKKVVSVAPQKDLSLNLHFVSPDTIAVEINYPLLVSRAESKSTLEKMTFDFKSGLQAAYLTAVRIIGSEISSHDFDIDHYVRTLPNVHIERQGIDTTRIYYYLESVIIESDPYAFHFAVERP